MQDDFRPILRELLATHPGLEFLQSTTEFQERYGMITMVAQYCPLSSYFSSSVKYAKMELNRCFVSGFYPEY